MRSRRFDLLYRMLGYPQPVLVGASAIVAAMLKAKPEEVKEKAGPLVAGVIQWTQESAWLLVPTLLLMAWGVKKVRQWVGDPAVRSEVEKRINEYRNAVFSDAAGGSSYQADRRVTLFRRKRFCWAWRCWPWSRRPWRNRWPWHGWLVPEFRSGSTPQLSRTLFRVPEGKHREAEGIAGRAWESEGWIHIAGLPDVHNPKCTAEDFEKYAQATMMSVEDIKADPPQGRAFAAVRVEVQGKGWGVMVIDTRAAEFTDPMNRKAKNKFFDNFNGLLSILLPRI